MSNQYPPPNPEQDPYGQPGQSGQPPPPPPPPPSSEPQWNPQSAGTPPPGSGGDPSYGQPGYGQPEYRQQPYGQPPGYPPGPGAPGGYGQATSNSGLAITSLVLGVVGLLFTFLCGFGAILGIGSVITGWLGLREIDASQGRKSGKGMAIAGIVTGVIAMVLLVGAIILVASGSFDSDLYLRTN